MNEAVLDVEPSPAAAADPSAAANVIVIYHAACSDGFCSAWLLWRVFGNSAEYVPARYGDDAPDVRGRDVYVVDFSYAHDVLTRMHDEAESIVVLDHHRTAEANLRGLGFCTFDSSKSGARLTWEHIHGMVYGFMSHFTPVARLTLEHIHGVVHGFMSHFTLESPPWLVTYTEDRDLWKWRLPASREVNAALRSYPLEFEAWDAIHRSGPTEYVTMGEAILREQTKLVDSHVKHAVEINLAGHNVLCVNATCHVSEIAGQLAADRPFGAVYFDTPTERVYSLRSTSDGADVSEIAALYGGGGHKHAAGFKTALPTQLPDFGLQNE